MSFEVRMVPPNWDHPKERDPYRGEMRYVAMLDEHFDDAVREWKEGYAAWERGERPAGCTEAYANSEYWEYEASPPDRERYRPWKDEEATWYQLWESVSEGTPVSPPFATKEELVQYLVTHGDFWDKRPWPLKRAQAFVAQGFSGGSFMIDNGVAVEARDIPLHFQKTRS